MSSEVKLTFAHDVLGTKEKITITESTVRYGHNIKNLCDFFNDCKNWSIRRGYEIVEKHDRVEVTRLGSSDIVFVTRQGNNDYNDDRMIAAFDYVWSVE